jgi:hypothetical protein
MSQQNSSRLYLSCKNGCDLIRYPYQHLFAATRRTCTAQHVYELLKGALFNCERSFCRKWRACCLNHWRRLGWHRALAAVLPVCSSPAHAAERFRHRDRGQQRAEILQRDPQRLQCLAKSVVYGRRAFGFHPDGRKFAKS